MQEKLKFMPTLYYFINFYQVMTTQTILILLDIRIQITKYQDHKKIQLI